MASLHVQTEQPLLASDSNQNHTRQQQHEVQVQVEEPRQQETSSEDETALDHTLARLETLLTLLGFNQYSPLRFPVSWSAFMVVGVVLPLVALHQCPSSDRDNHQITSFETSIVAFQACLAAVSLLCLSHNLGKYGLRRFLFVDRFSGPMACFRHDYIKQISGSLCLLILWVLPCFLLKTAREIIRLLYGQYGSWWLSVPISLALIISWTYVSAISLSASILFHLVCNLLVIHFDDYGKLLQRESDVLIFMEEHMRLRYHLSKISHRFRIYLLLQFLVVTASQFVTLLLITGYSGEVTVINGGGFAISTLVQVVGIIICLHAATKISHRAQGIVSLASRWHALITCASSDASQMRSSASAGSLEAANHLNSIHLDYSESDLESLDILGMPTSTHLASYMSSHHKRQAFVMYLHTNSGGMTIFGWTVDRGLLNTIFFIELSLVTFVLDCYSTHSSHARRRKEDGRRLTRLGLVQSWKF